MTRQLRVPPRMVDDDGGLGKEDVDIAGEGVGLDEENESSEGDAGKGTEGGWMDGG